MMIDSVYICGVYLSECIANLHYEWIMLNNDFTLTFQNHEGCTLLPRFSEQLRLQNKDLFASLIFSISWMLQFRVR